MFVTNGTFFAAFQRREEEKKTSCIPQQSSEMRKQHVSSGRKHHLCSCTFFLLDRTTLKEQIREKSVDEVIVWRSAGATFIQSGHSNNLTQCAKNVIKNIFLSIDEKRTRKKRAANVCRRSATENEVKLGTQFNTDRGTNLTCTGLY